MRVSAFLATNSYNTVRQSREFWNDVRIVIGLLVLLLPATGCIYRSIHVFEDLRPEDKVWVKAPVHARTKHKTVDSPRLPVPSLLSATLRPDGLPPPELIDTSEVAEQVRILSSGDSKFIRQAMARKAKYGGKLETILIGEGVPPALIVLAIIESGMRERIRSPSGAVGIWQFMRPTGKKYGLRVGLFEDERKDPLKSTRAAARYLKDLYAQYHDWSLVLAAYNAGETKVNSIIQEEGRNSFWELAKLGRFADQTRVHVYKFYAALQILSELEAEKKRGNP